MDRSFFKKVERKTGVDFDEIMTLANALTYADFSDEKQVRKIVKKVSRLANKPQKARYAHRSGSGLEQGYDQPRPA